MFLDFELSHGFLMTGRVIESSSHAVQPGILSLGDLFVAFPRPQSLAVVKWGFPEMGVPQKGWFIWLD